MVEEKVLTCWTNLHQLWRRAERTRREDARPVVPGVAFAGDARSFERSFWGDDEGKRSFGETTKAIYSYSNYWNALDADRPRRNRVR
jgi:hypothetical protein